MLNRCTTLIRWLVIFSWLIFDICVYRDVHYWYLSRSMTKLSKVIKGANIYKGLEKLFKDLQKTADYKSTQDSSSSTSHPYTIIFPKHVRRSPFQGRFPKLGWRHLQNPPCMSWQYHREGLPDLFQLLVLPNQLLTSLGQLLLQLFTSNWSFTFLLDKSRASLDFSVRRALYSFYFW